MPEAIINSLQRAMEAIDGVSAHFVFNADEMGRSSRTSLFRPGMS
jgi:hypothetical protein